MALSDGGTITIQQGSAVSIEATATSTGVPSIHIYVDREKVAANSSSTLTWSSSDLSTGDHSLKVWASSGNAKTINATIKVATNTLVITNGYANFAIDGSDYDTQNIETVILKKGTHQITFKGGEIDYIANNRNGCTDVQTTTDDLVSIRTTGEVSYNGSNGMLTVSGNGEVIVYFAPVYEAYDYEIDDDGNTLPYSAFDSVEVRDTFAKRATLTIIEQNAIESHYVVGSYEELVEKIGEGTEIKEIADTGRNTGMMVDSDTTADDIKAYFSKFGAYVFTLRQGSTTYSRVPVLLVPTGSTVVSQGEDTAVLWGEATTGAWAVILDGLTFKGARTEGHSTAISKTVTVSSSTKTNTITLKIFDKTDT